jgi:hypothetical protein
MSSTPRRTNNDHSTASFVSLDTSYSDTVVQAHHMALVVLRVVSEGRRLSRLNRFSSLQPSVARIGAQLTLAVFPGRITRHQIPWEMLPAVRHQHSTSTRTTLMIMIGVSLGCHD